jgi:hypothetical protein
MINRKSRYCQNKNEFGFLYLFSQEFPSQVDTPIRS